MHAAFKAGNHEDDEVEFYGSYMTALDEEVSNREKAQMTAIDVWTVTGYCFR